MAKILVAYYSRTGNTKNIAEAVFAGLDGDKTLQNIKDTEDVSPYDLVFVGFPVQSHSVPLPVEDFLKAIPPGKKIALFSTHGSLTGSRLSREAMEYAMVITSQTKVLGSFSCRGKISLQALETLGRSPEHQAWTEMAVSAASHPDERDREEAKAFSRWIISLYAQD
jgi:flavodoxin